ncbi:MAG TPA: hypothetical protein VFV66_27965 [Nonomuraea sp.]|nr:hypothetical protein [Nonomuraea sp.]
MLLLSLGYFLAYLPYAMLVKALASGALPGVPAPSSVLEVLPAAALGQLVAMPVFLAVSGRWRHARHRRVLGVPVITPGRETLAAGFFCAFIIATTTANLAFVGATVLVVLLLMRGGVLILSPLIDMLRRRHIAGHSWAALVLSIAAVAVAFGDVTDLSLAGPLLLGLGLYLFGYIGRFEIMSRTAKTGIPAVDRRYFAEEHAVAPVFQVVLLGVAALVGVPELREGFTGFLTTPTALAAAGIGVAYEVLFIFGTLIYLDVREYSWCVPANRCASLLSGVVAAYALAWLAGLNAPGPGQLTALALVVGAITALSAPTLVAWWRGRVTAPGLRLLFVCDGNTSRSPMAAAIAAGEVRATAAGAAAATSEPVAAAAPPVEPAVVPRIETASAGLAVRRRGAPMSDHARAALDRLGVAADRHRARQVNRRLCRGSTAIYCMTHAQREALLTLVPEARDRTFCLDAEADIPDPSGHSQDAYVRCARRIRHAVRARLAEHLGPDLSPQTAG